MFKANYRYLWHAWETFWVDTDVVLTEKKEKEIGKALFKYSVSRAIYISQLEILHSQVKPPLIHFFEHHRRPQQITLQTSL